MPKRGKKNRRTSKSPTTAVFLDDDVYEDDVPTVADSTSGSSHDAGRTKGHFNLADVTTDISSMICKMEFDEKLKILQKQAFELRKKGAIGEAKELQHVIKESNREKRDAEEEMGKLINARFIRKSHGIPDEHRTDDGDQSPIYGHYEVAKMKRMWGSGMDWNANYPFNSLWLRCLAAGDYEEMMKFIEQTPAGKIKELLEKRETLINASALFHVIKGSTLLVKDQNKFDLSEGFCDHLKIPKHVECLKKLIELGADIHARDFAGFTPLHYSVTCVGTPTTFELAKLLLENGADPNAKNRFGETPLVQPMLTKELECIRLLLDYGSDPTIKDNLGGTCLTTNVFDEDMNKLLYEARQKKARKMREEAKSEDGGILACEVCQKPSNRRCTGCYVARYCSRECQLSHWKSHKKACKENKERFVLVNLVSLGDGHSFTSYHDGKIWGEDGKALKTWKRNFLVKIQVPLSFEVDSRSMKYKPNMTSLTLYDKSKNVYGGIDPSEPSYQPLRELIESKGLDGIKGYFLAIFDKDSRLRINIKDLQLPAKW